MESGFAVVTYFLLSLLNSNDRNLIRPLCSVKLPAIGAIAGRSVAMLRIRTLASQWIPLGFSLGIGTTGHRDRPRRRADHAYNRSSESSRDAPPGTRQSAASLERCMIVPAVKEVCRLQSRHSCDRARVFGSAPRRSPRPRLTKS